MLHIIELRLHIIWDAIVIRIDPRRTSVNFSHTSDRAFIANKLSTLAIAPQLIDEVLIYRITHFTGTCQCRDMFQSICGRENLLWSWIWELGSLNGHSAIVR